MATHDLKFRLLQQEDANTNWEDDYANTNWEDDFPRYPPRDVDEIDEVPHEQIPTTWEAMLMQISQETQRR